MNGLDLFSGIGGISLALSPWVRTVAYCEIDPFACGVLMSRMANGQLHKAPIWDDATTLRKDDFGDTRIDIITGGFPCQDISLAGSGDGLAGERSGLYREVIRIVSDLRPSFVFLENVAAIRGRGAHVVAGDLAAIGYACRWTTFEAAEVGAPHLRDRWWILATNTNSVRVRKQPERKQRKPAKRGDSKPGNKGAKGRGSQAATDTNGGRLQKQSKKHNDGGSKPLRRDANGRFALPHWEAGGRPFPALRRMDDGLSHRVDRLRVLGNAVVPRAAREAFMLLSGLK